MQELESVLESLKQPEYIHVLLNPLPVYGLSMGILGLALGFLMRSRAGRVVGLILIFIACASVWPVVHYGHAGYDRVYAMSDPDAQAWLDLHRDRADACAWVFYLTAFLALAAVLLPIRWPQADLPLALVVFAGSLACVALGGWISHAGGKIRHSEFRDGPPEGLKKQIKGQQGTR